MENDCPHAHRTFKDSPDFCDINGKICALEDNMKCDLWKDIKYERGLDE